VLIASLALNLLMLGTLGGSIWAFRNNVMMGDGVNAHLLGFTRTLPTERRYEVWQATRTERRALRPSRKEVRKARAEARKVLNAAPFDKQKFADAQMRVLEAEVKARREAHQLFIAVASVLTPEERAAFAKWRPTRHGDRMRPYRRDGDPDDTKPQGSAAQPR
jgi:uncharacterized membrane protein